MSPHQDASHFSACAEQEARRAREARLNGADRLTIAQHNERAVRFQAMALRLQRSAQQQPSLV